MKILWSSIVCIAVLSLASCGKSKADIEAAARSTEKTKLEVRKKLEDEERLFEAKLMATASAAQETVQKTLDQRTNSARLLSEAERHADDPLIIKKFQAAILVRLKDPTSAQFRDLKLNHRREALCGMVNSKNGFGGYTGFSAFVATETKAYLSTGNKDLEDMLYREAAERQGCI